MRIEGKNIILTGASTGIGKALLALLVTYPRVRIVAVARNVEPITAIDGVVFPFSTDLSTEQGVDSIFAYSQKVFGNTDLFIANAGFAYLEKLEGSNWQHIQNIFSLNVVSPVYSLQKLMQEDNRPIHFVCTISGVAFTSLPYYALYTSTKAALHHFVEAFRYEVRKNVSITSVYPVATKTDFFDKASQQENTPLPFLRQDALTVAKAIVKGIEQNKKQVYPSFLFRLFLPLGRAFPFLFRIYAISEKRKSGLK